MITFAGILPKLNNFTLQEIAPLQKEVEDFFWKVKSSNPNLIFIFSNDFKPDNSSNSFKLFVGKDYKYLKNSSIFVDLITTINEQYQVELSTELCDEDIFIDPYNVFLQELIEFFPDTNIVFVEYPEAKQSDYAIFGQLLGELAKEDRFNLALIANGHLSKSVDSTKVSFDSRAKEIDQAFVDHLKVDMFSVFNMNFYTSRIESLGGGQVLQSIKASKQALYEGILILVSALSTLPSKKIHSGYLDGFEIYLFTVISGVHQFLSILYRATDVDFEYKPFYSIQEYVELVIRSKIVNFNISPEKILLELPDNFSACGVFLSLFENKDFIGCFGDPLLEINSTNIKQVLDALVFNFLNSNSFKKIRINDLPSLKINVIFSKKGFSFFKLKLMQDLLDYEIISIKTNKSERFYHFKNKDINSFLNIFANLQLNSKEIKVFGLK